jgi:hypothetical protein
MYAKSASKQLRRKTAQSAKALGGTDGILVVGEYDRA